MGFSISRFHLLQEQIKNLESVQHEVFKAQICPVDSEYFGLNPTPSSLSLGVWGRAQGHPRPPKGSKNGTPQYEPIATLETRGLLGGSIFWDPLGDLGCSESQPHQAGVCHDSLEKREADLDCC